MESTPLTCRNPRCSTLAPVDAEICDECGQAELAPFPTGDAWLTGQDGERPVGFAVRADRPNTLGRSVPLGEPLEIDLARFAAGGAVHRRHAIIERRQTDWWIVHTGRNPLIIRRGAEKWPVDPGSSGVLRSGDWLVVGTIALHFSVRGEPA